MRNILSKNDIAKIPFLYYTYSSFHSLPFMAYARSLAHSLTCKYHFFFFFLINKKYYLLETKIPVHSVPLNVYGYTRQMENEILVIFTPLHTCALCAHIHINLSFCEWNVTFSFCTENDRHIQWRHTTTHSQSNLIKSFIKFNTYLY